MVAQYIATQPILDLCEQSTWQPGARVYCWWCKQAGIYLEGAKKRVAEAGTVLESEVEAELDVELKEDSGGQEESKGACGSSGSEWSEADN